MIFRQALIKQSVAALRATTEHGKAAESALEWAETLQQMSSLTDEQLIRSSLFGASVTLGRA